MVRKYREPQWLNEDETARKLRVEDQLAKRAAGRLSLSLKNRTKLIEFMSALPNQEWRAPLEGFVLQGYALSAAIKAGLITKTVWTCDCCGHVRGVVICLRPAQPGSGV